MLASKLVIIRFHSKVIRVSCKHGDPEAAFIAADCSLFDLEEIRFDQAKRVHLEPDDA